RSGPAGAARLRRAHVRPLGSPVENPPRCPLSARVGDRPTGNARAARSGMQPGPIAARECWGRAGGTLRAARSHELDALEVTGSDAPGPVPADTRSARPGPPDYDMEGIVRIRSSLIVWVAVALAAGAATPAVAKKAPAPTCAAQFAIAQSGVANVPASVLRLVSIDATGVTVSTDCGTVVSRPKRTRTGWKFRAHWRPCDGKAKVVL